MSCQNTGGRRRKMRGGNGYGVGQPIAVGALEYVPNMTSVPDGAAYTPTGGRRRRRGGAEDVDVVPVVGDVVSDSGLKLFPQQQCPSGRDWHVALYGYPLVKRDGGMDAIDYPNEIKDPTNDNGDPLGVCEGTPRAFVGASAPRFEGGRRRRRTRRRGGTQEVSAPPDPDMVTKSQCPEPNTFSPSVKNAAGVMLGYCRPPGAWQIATKLNKHKGGRRHTRRKHKGRRRTMRGGGSVAGVGYSFTGEGARGLADQSAYPSNLPPSDGFAIPTGTR